MMYDKKCNICNKVKENSLSNTCNSCWLKFVNKWSWGNLGNGEFDND